MIRVLGTKQLITRLRAVQEAPAGLMRVIGLSAVREQKKLVPRKTGNLGRSIHLERVTRDTAVTAASAPYAAAVEFGTRPHIIRPRRGRVLRFPAPGTPRTLGGRARKGGSYVYATFVRHPGTRAQPFMTPGAQAALASAGIANQIIMAWNDAV